MLLQPQLSKLKETKNYQSCIESGAFINEHINAIVYDDKITDINFSCKDVLEDVTTILNVITSEYNTEDFAMAKELMEKLHNNDKISNLRDLVNAVLKHETMVKLKIAPINDSLEEAKDNILTLNMPANEDEDSDETE